jgi:hypothetical protein
MTPSVSTMLISIWVAGLTRTPLDASSYHARRFRAELIQRCAKQSSRSCHNLL